MTIKAETKAYQLLHPEHQVPTMAEFVEFWVGSNGRNCGLVLRFKGEDHNRSLTYVEIAQLQKGVGDE